MMKAYLSSDQEKHRSFERISNEDLMKVRNFFFENESSVTILQEECTTTRLVKRFHEYMNAMPVTTNDDTLFPYYNLKTKSFSLKIALDKDKLGSLIQTLSEKANCQHDTQIIVAA